MKVLGIDPGLTRPGFFYDDTAYSLNLSGLSEWDAYAELAEFYSGMLGKLTAREAEGLLICCENPVLPKFGIGVKTLLAQGAIRCITKQLSLARIFVPVYWVDVPPTSLKKFATGFGNAHKSQVFYAAREAGALVATEDEADAYWCWRIGQMYGNYAEVPDTVPEGYEFPEWTTVMPEVVTI